MALDLLSVPPSEAGPPPSKRRKRGWDVPDPALLAQVTRLQFQVAAQLLQEFPLLASPQDGRLASASKDNGGTVKKIVKSGKSEVKHYHRKGSSKQDVQHEDDPDGHFNYKNGEILSSRYKILGKMGEGTFGQVLECLDQESQDIVAIKILRSAERYRDAAMIEIDILQTLSENDRRGSRGKAFKYFKHERSLDWPSRYSTRESVRAVERLPQLRDLLSRHADKVPNSFINLLERMFCYDPLNRLTAREALQHPFFREELWHDSL